MAIPAPANGEGTRDGHQQVLRFCTSFRGRSARGTVLVCVLKDGEAVSSSVRPKRGSGRPAVLGLMRLLIAGGGVAESPTMVGSVSAGQVPKVVRISVAVKAAICHL